jgi:hypothetical protein
MDATGNFVITWMSMNQDGSGWGIYAQLYNSAGAPQGAEFKVNTTTINDQQNPSVAMAPGGNFIITWSSDNQDGSYWGVYAQSYSSAGVAQGGEFIVNTYTTHYQRFSNIATNGTGVVIAWTSTYQDGSNDGVYAQRYTLQPVCVEPPNTTMIAWYPFDELSGMKAENLATGNTGTLGNSPVHIPGKVAGALRFDGYDDYVESPSTIVTNIGPAGLPATCSGSYSTCRGDFSIDTWIRMPSSSSNLIMIILEKEVSSGSTLTGYSVWIFNGYLILVLADGGAGNGGSNYTSTQIPIATLYNNQWHHIAVTVSRRGNPAGIKWYFNGVLISTNNPTIAPTRYGSLANSAPLRIGSPPPPSLLGWLWFKGDLDEVEIFNRELTQVEVKAIFAAGTAGKCKP